MEQYYDRGKASLKFHKFNWYVIIPVSFLLNVATIVNEISNFIFFTWVHAFDIFFFAAALTLMAICFIGFFKWKPCAWYAMIAFLCVNLVNKLFAFIISVAFIPDQVAGALVGLLVSLACGIPIASYYMKRRPLFFPAMHETDTQPAPNKLATHSSQPALENEQHDNNIASCPPLIQQQKVDGQVWLYCTNCGTKFQGNFCPRCAAAAFVFHAEQPDNAVQEVEPVADEKAVISNAPPVPASEKLFCGYCGQQLSLNYLFCTKCGQPTK